MKLYKGMPVIYTDFLLHKWQGAKNFVWFSVLRPKYKDDIGIHEHEWRHSVQALKGLFVFHALGMLFSKKYRAACEIEAYAAQLKYSTNKVHDLNLFAQYIATRYKLDIGFEEALHRLKEKSTSS